MEHPAPQGSAGNGLSVLYDRAEALIRIVGIGMWSPDQLRDHYLTCDRLLKVMRAECGAARVLADFTQAPVQTGETAAVIHEWTPLIYKPGDHVAVVCITTLFTMQIKRQANIDNLKTFADMASALAWLAAFPARRAAGPAGTKA